MQGILVQIITKRTEWRKSGHFPTRSNIMPNRRKRSKCYPFNKSFAWLNTQIPLTFSSSRLFMILEFLTEPQPFPNPSLLKHHTASGKGKRKSAGNSECAGFICRQLLPSTFRKEWGEKSSPCYFSRVIWIAAESTVAKQPNCHVTMENRARGCRVSFVGFGRASGWLPLETGYEARAAFVWTTAIISFIDLWNVCIYLFPCMFLSMESMHVFHS